MAKIYLCNTSDVEPGHPRRFDLKPGLSVALFHTQKGWFAVENRCPHASGTLVDGIVTREVLMCVWHGWKFNMKTGKCLNVPGETLRVFPLYIENGQIFLTLTEKDAV